MKSSDIPQMLANKANYHINVGLRYFNQTIQEYIDDQGLILNPDFQRGYIWTEEQQIAYIEYILRGGSSGKDLYFNKPSWHTKAQTKYDDFVCVDGLQRITLLNEFEDQPKFIDPRMHIHINDLQLESDVLRWYIEMNSGGTPHTKEEIVRVKKMLQECEGR